MSTRSPIVTVLAHVDHGKTSLLDRIRKTTVVNKEAGGITQLISTTFVPIEHIKNMYTNVLERFKAKTDIPGLLFVDTPGHASFTTMRERGGYIADLGILLIDINEGIMPQTEESLEILKKTKTPFVVALNKTDKIRGWQNISTCFVDNIKEQSDDVIGEFENTFYSIIEQLRTRGIPAERYDRISDFTKNVAVIPISAKTGEGVADLLLVLMGLAQQYLKDKLEVGKQGKGVVLEVKETRGLGITLDVIIYDGIVKKDDYIVVISRDVKIRKIRALLEPRNLKDIRRETEFKNVKQIVAASGIRIAAPDLEGVIAGTEIRTAQTLEEAEKIKKKMEKERESVEINNNKYGIVLRADTLGSLEALENLFKDHEIRDAKIDDIKKEAIIEAEANNEIFDRVVIGFNVNVTDDARILAKENKIKTITSDIIYRLLEDYEEWIEKLKQEKERETKEMITMPGKFRILPGFVFRSKDPAITGCEVIAGIIKPGYQLINKDGAVVGKIKEIQKENKRVDEAKHGDRVAVSILGATIGRQIKEEEILYTNIKEEDYKNLNLNEKMIDEQTKKTLEEIAEIKRIHNKMFGLL